MSVPLDPALAPRAWRSGPPMPALPASTLWDALTSGDTEATWLVFHLGKERVPQTRAQLAELALKWASAIVARGAARPGGRVGVLLPNSPDFIGAFFAAQALGMVAVPLPWPVVDGAPERVRESLQPVLERAKLDVLCTAENFVGTEWGCPAMSSLSLRERGEGRGEGPHSNASSPLTPTLSPLAQGEGVPAFIQFTSGSTGNPRGAVIPQTAALGSATAMATALSLGQSDVGVSWLPFFHDMGLVGVLLTSLVARFPVHILRPGDFLMRPRKWLDLVSEQKATLTVGPNFAWELLVRRVQPDGLDLSSVRCALNGSEPVHRTTLDGFSAKFAAAGFKPDAFLPVYGLAEATLGVSFSRPASLQPDLSHAGRSIPAAGTLIPGIELCVCDEHGNAKNEGEEGELCVRGPTVMQGYFEHAEATAAALRGDWLRTGDLGVMRDGVVYVTGREKELVIQAGRKFHPYDIERIVADLVEATPNGVAAVSRPDPSQGSESLVVVVELRRVSGAIDPMIIKGELLKQLGVRADVVEFVPAGTLPRTTSGKVKRKQIAAGDYALSPSGSDVELPLPAKRGEGRGEGPLS